MSGLGIDAINYINSSLNQQKSAKSALEQKIQDSFYMPPAYDHEEYEKTISEIRQQDK